MKAHGINLAERLKSRRKELGLSQNSLAQSCGVSQPTIANWERGGHVPRHNALTSIAASLDVDPIWLLSGSMPEDKNPAHQHLSKPIHNIPVFDWPSHFNDLNGAQPSRYLTMSVAGDKILALNARKDSLFPVGTILIFDRSIGHESGRYLTQEGEDIKLVDLVLAANDDLSDAETGKIIGRLILSVQPH